MKNGAGSSKEKGEKIKKKKFKERKNRQKKIKRILCSFFLNIKKFSDESLHEPGSFFTYKDNFSEESAEHPIMTAYCSGNGNSERNRGYVSLIFKCRMPLFFTYEQYFNFSCEIAVKDVAGNKRFVRTFSFPSEHVRVTNENSSESSFLYFIDEYVSRKTILNNSDELLHNDRLILIIDANLKLISNNFVDIESVINSSFHIADSESPVIVLNLKSKLARRLYEVSSVFRGICDSPMIENETGKVCLHSDDEDAFRNASRIIMGVKEITFQSFEEIVQLYIFADKYDLQNIIEACRGFCENILKNQNRTKLFYLPEEIEEELRHCKSFDDEGALKEIVNKFLINNEENKYKLKLEDLCNKDFISYLHFVLEEDDVDRSEFDFYK